MPATKSDKTADEIDLDRAYEQPRKPNWRDRKRVNSFDTETRDGRVFLLQYAFGSKPKSAQPGGHPELSESGYIANEDVDRISDEQIFNLLTDYRNQSAINTWYNLGFDAEAIFGGLLNDEALTTLTTMDEVSVIFAPSGREYEVDEDVEDFVVGERETSNGIEEITKDLTVKVWIEGEDRIYWEEQKAPENVVVVETESELTGHYDITYLKDKLLSIRHHTTNRSGKTYNYYRHYDISQFFFDSLGSVADEWLDGDFAKLDTVDTSKFGDKEYIRNNWDDIVEYGVVDAEVTRELSEALITEAEELGYPMGSPISTGFMASEYLRLRCWIDGWVEAIETHLDVEVEDVEYEKQTIDRLKDIAKDHLETDEDYEEFRDEITWEHVRKSGLPPKAVTRDMWESYYGGRFEVLDRGNVGRVAGPDINSAYPSVLKDLPDPRTLEWSLLDDEPSLEDLQDYDYGVVRATVSTDESRRIQPFAQKDFSDSGVVKFPALDSVEITTIKPILEFAVSEGMVESYEVERAWVGEEIDSTERRFAWLEDAYETRYEYKDAGDKSKESLIKLIINSVYGITAQTTWQTRFVADDELDEGGLTLDSNEQRIATHHLQEGVGEVYSDGTLVKSLRAGPFWNPFYATYITGLTRLELMRKTVEYDLEDDVSMFATDCVMYDKDAFDQTDFEENEFEPRQLGAWDNDYGIGEETSAFIAGSGVYEIEKLDVLPEDWEDVNEETKEDYDGKRDWYLDNRWKTKTRGFPEAVLEPNLAQMGRENPEGIPIENSRPGSLAESLTNDDIEAGEFFAETRELKADFDSKRNWEIESPTFEDLLENRDTSEPTTLTAEDTDTSDWWLALDDEQREEMLATVDPGEQADENSDEWDEGFSLES